MYPALYSTGKYKLVIDKFSCLVVSNNQLHSLQKKKKYPLSIFQILHCKEGKAHGTGKTSLQFLEGKS